MTTYSAPGALRWASGGWVYPLPLCLFLTFLLIGADLLAFKVGGFTVRIVTFPILGAFFLLAIHPRLKICFDGSLLFLSILIILCSFVSLINSYDAVRTISYDMWMVFTFIIVIPIFYSMGYYIDAESMVRMCFSIYRICSALLFLEFSVKLAAPGLYDTAYRFRPHIWFYEPSYAAIYYAAYVGSSLYLVSSDCRWARRDLVIAILSMGMLVSATAFMGVMFSLLICLLFSKHRLKLVLISAVVVLLPALGTAFYLQNNKIFLQIFGFLAKGDGSLYGLLMETVMRGGIRPMSFLWGIDAFRQNPWTGIGFGADQSYTAGTALPPEAAQFLTPWLLNVYGAPFINPFVEAAGTMGIPGLVAFCLLCAYPVVRFMQIRKSPDATMTNALFVGFFVMFLTLQDSGTFLRFYVWSGYAMAIGSAARLRMASA